MALTGLAGVSIFVTLSLRSLIILGESVLASDPDKDGELKATEKRINNFRVPVEMPYDPNFWPARGRRGRHPERTGESDICDGYGSLRCPGPEGDQPGKRRWPTSDAEPNLPDGPEDELYGKGERACRGNAPPGSEASGGRAPGKIRDFQEADVLFGPKRLEKSRYKKQRHFRLPQLILYGNGVFWEPENPYAEKKKKEDIFWVARGKKNSFYRK